MAKTLITGATGYIGSKLANYYLRKGDEVRLLVRDIARLSKKLNQNCQVIIGDLIRPTTLVHAVRDVDHVIHSAGLLGHWGTSYKQMYEVNVTGAVNLVNACVQAGARRIIHLSAGGVTGPLGSEPADESYKPAPVTYYERTKWKGEQRILGLAERNGLNLLVVRPTFTYGPGDPHKLNLFRAVQRGRFAFIGGKSSTVHPVYIDDLINGIDLALESNIRHFSFIIGGEAPVTKKDLIQSIAEALGVATPSIVLPVFVANCVGILCELSATVFRVNPPLTRSRVLALSRDWGYSINLAKKTFGYQPQTNLKEGIKKTVEWYRTQGWL